MILFLLDGYQRKGVVRLYGSTRESFEEEEDTVTKEEKQSPSFLFYKRLRVIFVFYILLVTFSILMIDLFTSMMFLLKTQYTCAPI